MTIFLSNLKPGQTARVVAVTSPSEDRLLKLSAFGLIPGSFVTLQQDYPAYILRIGETTLSLDETIAQDIHLDVRME